MRPLTEEETKTMFEKLAKYIGRNIKNLIDRSDAIYCFRLHKNWVYYVSEVGVALPRACRPTPAAHVAGHADPAPALGRCRATKLASRTSGLTFVLRQDVVKKATNVAGENLVSLGTCFGKFTNTRKFHLHITALDCLAPFARFKVWLKPTSELSFLYGNHITKAGLGRITEVRRIPHHAYSRERYRHV